MGSLHITYHDTVGGGGEGERSLCRTADPDFTVGQRTDWENIGQSQLTGGREVAGSHLHFVFSFYTGGGADRRCSVEDRNSHGLDSTNTNL